MNSVRKALRAGDLEKGTFDRLRCSACGTTLKTRSEAETIGMVRTCPDCGEEWQEIK